MLQLFFASTSQPLLNTQKHIALDRLLIPIGQEFVFFIKQPRNARQNGEDCREENASQLPMMIAVHDYVDDFQRLLLHVLLRAGVFNDKVRSFGLLVERHLCLYSLLRFGEREIVAIHKTSDLNVLLGHDADDLVNVIN